MRPERGRLTDTAAMSEALHRQSDAAEREFEGSAAMAAIAMSRDRYWRSHIALGFGVLLAEVAAALAYFAESPQGPHRASLFLVSGLLGLAALAGLQLSGSIVRLPWRAAFVTSTSVACIVVSALCAGLDRGIESPLIYLCVLPVIHLALLAPPRLVLIGAVTACGSTIILGLGDGDIRFPQESLIMLSAVVGGMCILSVASAMHRSRLQAADLALVEELFRRGVTDELTGCRNFRAFHERLGDEVDRATRYGHSLCLVVCDIDYFSSYNDRYGHAQGDATLAGVGRRLLESARSTDVVARTGGDEFAILLPETSLPDATAVARRLLDNTEPEAPTLSIGVAQLAAGEPTAKRLFRDADRAMYAAKRDGRARVVTAGRPARLLSLVRETTPIDVDRKRIDTTMRLLQQENLETEMLLGLLAHESPVGFAFIGTNGRLVRLNAALAEVNVGQAASQLGRPINELGPEVWPALWPLYLDVLASGHAVRNVEVGRTAPAHFGEAEAWLANLYPVEAATEMLGVGVIVVDISERKRLEQASEALTESVIAALGAAAEARDPYTAGHQRRVSEIAIDIATRMGLPAHDIKGIGLAAAIHDIGKVAVPAEILSRPAKLTDDEMQLVRGHAEAGYRILRDVAFPWPVAEMVRQHHERMDGSGYPRGLRGDEILPGARIVAVADVVEAMAAHRPYRPSVGIEPALEHILEHRQDLFDPAVVDTCVEMFRDGSVAAAGA
jgi:diguanylate cyclase (GGDEF)-like protein